jgi:triphosphoribosyl-dephospho-CoA synthase
MKRLTPRLLAAAAGAACLLEARAPKPGNVGPGRGRPKGRGHRGLAYRDFVLSAQAVETVFRKRGGAPVGRLALEAVRATRRLVGTNTNLGIVLLLAPLLKAARAKGPAPLRERLRQVLDRLDVRDARDAYRAIRLARPGGLGRASSQDVRRAPTATLLECMRLAADRDAVAREYATAYAATFEVGLPAFRRLRSRGESIDAAVADTYLTLLASAPDTLVRRRHGAARAAAVSRAAAEALRWGGARTPAGRLRMSRLDARLRRRRPPVNPGATADLVAAVLFVWLAQGKESR